MFTFVATTHWSAHMKFHAILILTCFSRLAASIVTILSLFATVPTLGFHENKRPHPESSRRPHILPILLMGGHHCEEELVQGMQKPSCYPKSNCFKTAFSRLGHWRKLNIAVALAWSTGALQGWPHLHPKFPYRPGREKFLYLKTRLPTSET